MPTLHLGVIDIPYAQAPRKYRGKRVSGTQTTGDVAGWLETRYGVMQAFFDAKKAVVVDAIEDGLLGALENMMTGRAPLSQDPFGSATSKIDDAFKQFVSTKEVEALGIPGVPTGAAQRGVNHRLKRPYVRRQPRPSFIDTGLYQASFKSWVDL